MSSTSKYSVPISSFSSPYVPLDLVLYLKSGQIMPFHVFNQIVMPDFLHHLSNQTKSLRSSRTEGQENGTTEEDDDSSAQNLLDKIKKDVIHIYKACGRLEEWEASVNEAINQLVLRSLEDAVKMYSPGQTIESIGLTQESVSKLKETIYSPLKFSSENLDSVSFKSSESSVARKLEHTVSSRPVQLCDPNTGGEKADEIRAFYDGLDSEDKKKCLLCFSVFPENAVIKKKVLVHWWIGEEFIKGEIGAEKIANNYFKEFIEKGLIEPVHKKQRPSADSCKMHPCVRNAVIMIAEKEKFAEFDANKNPTANISSSERPCLVKTEEGNSIRDFTYGFQTKREHVQSLFNVSERRLEFKVNWFSKMKKVKVLQLGKWQSSANQLIEVEDSEFLKGLKKMKLLRYLSLRGVSRITELPSSICKLGHLRILNLNGCHDLEKLPDGIGSLKKLTHLDMYECSLISHMPKGIARLSELQILKGFVVAEPKSGAKCCRLEDLTKLEKLNKLSIHIDRKISEAKKGKRELSSLSQFKKLESLSISWSQIYNSDEHDKGIRRANSQVKRLTSLEESQAKTLPVAPPLPAGLKKLDLLYFPGSKISQWFSLSENKNLRKLYVRGGSLTDQLLVRGGNLSDLRSDKCFWEGVESLRLGFLRNLQIDWGEMQQLFPKLIYLEICECRLLSSFPCDNKSGVWKKESGTT